MMYKPICRNGWLFGAMLLKGDNSGRYKIINNERELRGVESPKQESAF